MPLKMTVPEGHLVSDIYVGMHGRVVVRMRSSVNALLPFFVMNKLVTVDPYPDPLPCFQREERE